MIFPGKYINTATHFAVGMKWPMAKKKQIGIVTMHAEGFECSCKSKQRCNHIRAVEQLLSGGDSFLARLIKQ